MTFAQRSRDHEQKRLERDGYVQNMMDWLVGMLRFCLKRGKRTENRRKAHGWIDRLRVYFMTGISWMDCINAS